MIKRIDHLHFIHYLLKYLMIPIFMCPMSCVKTVEKERQEDDRNIGIDVQVYAIDIAGWVPANRFNHTSWMTCYSN